MHSLKIWLGNIAALLIALAIGFPAVAGDFAKRDIIGFSADGSRFAFEEYGQQDGSGFPYSHIYVIDTAIDRWTDGSPFRVIVKDETASIEEARKQAHAEAMAALAPITEAGTVIATNSHLEVVGDPYRMVAQPRYYQSSYPDLVEYRIEKKFFQGPEICRDWGITFGFTLKQLFTAEGRTPTVLHADSGIPESRSCPLDYRFADIVTYFPEGGEPVVAILILMERVGFEGPDGRYLAVTAPLFY